MELQGALVVGMNEEKKVRIIFESRVDRQKVFELMTFGSIVFKGEDLYIRYAEETVEGEIRNVIKYSGDQLVVIRSGAINMRQIFKKGEETSTTMRSKLANLHVGAKTDSLRYLEDASERKHLLEFAYALSVQYDTVGYYEISLKAIEV